MTVDKSRYLWYNKDTKEMEVLTMYIKKNNYDRNYPYTICGSWDDKVYTTEEDLKTLKKEIEKILNETNKNKKMLDK